MSRAITKYGWENIEHNILADGLTESEAEDMEIRLIKEMDLQNPARGYNIADGGNHSRCSEETKKKIAEKSKNRHHTDEFKHWISEKNSGSGNYMYGKHHSEETKQKISEALKGHTSPNKGKYGGAHPSAKTVIACDPKTGVAKYKFTSIVEATESARVSKSCIMAALSGKQHTSADMCGNMQNVDWISAYYQQIVDGSVTVGKWIRTLYEYIIHGMESKLFKFDQKKANSAIEWIESHSFHVEGPLAPGPFTLEIWEKAFVSCIFGIVDNETEKRVFREVLLLVGRKNGKSLLASGIANYVLQVDGGYGCKVFNVAPKLDQADIIYGNAWLMMQLDPNYIERKQEIESQRQMSHTKVEDDPTLPRKRISDIYIPATNSSMKKIAFSAKKSDGFNPSLGICDEIAAWPGDQGMKQYEVIRSGMGARPEPLLLSCTTSGYINDGIFDELMKRSTRFLLGESREQRLLPFLYMIDDVDKWNDINELKKSNPNLGVSVTRDYLLEEISIAEGSLSKKAEFLTKYCNIKQNSSQAWLNTEGVAKCFSGTPLKFEDFSRCYAVAGLDLSQTTDLTAAICIIERAGKLNVFAHFWMPAERIDEATARDGVPYRAYIARGFLSPSGENFVDYHDCEQWFHNLIEKYKIYPLKLGYDRYSANYLIQSLASYGYQVDDVYQGENLTPVINDVDGMIRDGAFECGDNDLLKIHFLNSALKLNNETNRKKLVKISQTARIDGMAAFLDAMTVRQKWWNEIGAQLRNAKR